MKILRTDSQLHSWISDNKNPSFIPTMGFLHNAHLELMRQAQQLQKPVLVSLFVNPAQFAPGEDLEVYPRDEEGDIEKLKTIGVDAVYIPSVAEMYPDGVQKTDIELPKMFSEIEGEIRPGFFEGITEVLIRLFEKIEPGNVFFGQKDYQQTLLVQWLVLYKNYPIQVHICPIVREKDGLAMSSRNAYLSDAERQSAVRISEGVFLVKDRFEAGERNATVLESFLEEYLQKDPLTSQIDFLEIRDAKSLKRVKKITEPVVLLVYVKMETPRLLDNIVLIP